MQATQYTSPPAVTEPNPASPPLVVRVGPNTYTFDESDAPIIIGRQPPAQIIITDDRISPAHVRIDHTPTGWITVDQNNDGIYVDGVQHTTVPIRDGMTIHLENPHGISVTFGHQTETPPNPPDDLYDEDEDEYDPEQSPTDPGIAHAGAAVAARREELKLSRRQLARAGIVNAGALGAFEKGRRWPRTTTRAKIENALQLPHGTIERWLREGNDDITQRTDADSNTVRASVMTEAVEVALTTINAAIASLPETTDPTFSARARTILADLRRLESVAANAAQTTKGSPHIALALSTVRKRYKELTLRAARAPGATLGQQLYAARHRTELSVEETANAAGVPVEAVTAAEAELPLDDKTMTALSAMLTALTRRP